MSAVTLAALHARLQSAYSSPVPERTRAMRIGTVAAATGTGTWSKVPDKHAWKLDYVLELNDGSKIRSVGEIALETLKFTGTNYSA